MTASIMVDIDGLRTLSQDLASRADHVAGVVRTIAGVPPPDVETYGTQLVVDRMDSLLAAWRAELGELREAIGQMSRNAGMTADEAADTDQKISDELRPSELGFPEGTWLPGLPDTGGNAGDNADAGPAPPGGRWLPGRPGKNVGQVERD